MRIFAVKTDPISGRAVLGTIELACLEQVEAGAPVPKTKKPNERAEPHHPKLPVLLKVRSGSHTIYVPSLDGWSEVEACLQAGQFILFCDFEPRLAPLPRLRFCYSGHWSKAGAEGAEIETMECAAEINLDAMDWKDGATL